MDLTCTKKSSERKYTLDLERECKRCNTRRLMYPLLPRRSPRNPTITVTMQDHAYTGTDRRLATVALYPEFGTGNVNDLVVIVS